MAGQMGRPRVHKDPRAITISTDAVLAEAMCEAARRQSRSVSGMLSRLFVEHVRSEYPDLAERVAGQPPLVQS